MHQTTSVESMTAALDLGVTKSGAPGGMAKLTPLHREVVVDGLPCSPAQEIRVIQAVLAPGDLTPYHSHRFPVTVYVTRGVFTLRLDGREPVRVAAGETYVEPARVRMTGSNDGTEQAEMVLFYVCEPNAPFADPVTG